MAANGGSTNEDNWSEPNASSTEDVLAAISAFEREVEEMITRTLQRFESTVRPWISQLVEQQIGLVKQEVLASMKENHATDESTAVVKKLKLQFRNRIAPQVITGMPLLSENQTPIEISLVDAQTEEIVTTGVESTAEVEIMGFRVGDDDSSMTIGEFQERLMSDRKGKRVLQGNTCLQLKEGVGFIQSKISFTHSSKHTKNGAYRLGAIVVDAALRNGVEVAWSETFVMKDGRSKYSEKHPYPLLLDEVCHLQHISYKGTRFKDMKAKGVITVKDLLTLFYTDQKRLEDILKLKAHSKFWNDIVENALASNGLFLYLDPRNQQKTGVVLNVKLQLTALILEPHLYVQVNHLSDKQKASLRVKKHTYKTQTRIWLILIDSIKQVDSRNLVKFASEHFEMLKAFEDETSLKEYLQSGITHTLLPTSDQSLGTFNILKEPTTPYSQVTYTSSGLTEQTKSMNNSNFHLGQSTNQTSTVTSQSERAKEKVPFNDQTVYSQNHYQKYIASHLASLEGLTELNCGTATAKKITDAGTSSQDVNIFSQGQEEIEDFQSSGVTSQSEQGKEKVPFEDETVYSKNYFQAYTSSEPTNLEGLNKLSFGTATAHNSIDAGTSSQAVDIFSDMEKLEEFQRIFSDDYDFHLASSNIECHSNPTIYKKRKYC
ncbi:CALMODULIN-BINDING PROTEIN60 [Artemisia annua]|uniref:CALMODULIN-BINDING PROTEIN60 n=1 Tax=Artemisia annua TaxID=35608 RepID=A0A2U1Q320_ARTAN|nr:CALMODULIN-BINDING PROTEIN60 [Artemisia annua]